MRRILGVGFWLTLLTASCSWSRFDEVTKDSPVVELKRPKNLSSGFGSSVFTQSVDGSNLALVSGTPGVSFAALFELGDADRPSLDAVNGSICRTDDTMTCFLSSSPVGVPATALDGVDADARCFATGLGSVRTDRGAQLRGLLFECEGEDGTVVSSRELPEGGSTALEEAIDELTPLVVALATDRADAPALVAGIGSERVAWVYPGGSEAPLELVAGDRPDRSYGQRVAALQVGDRSLFVVAAPEAGHVYVFTLNEGVPSYLGCLGGVAGFGRSLAVGAVSDERSQELLIADPTRVRVFDAEALLALDEVDTSDCDANSLPSGVLRLTLRCEETADVSDCEGSEFGAALAVADLDGDGDGEVVVGAPRIKVRDVAEAGALLVYDAEGDDEEALLEARFSSAAESADFLGSSVAAVSVDGRDALLAGAPGKGKAALFYCSSLTPAGASARCL